jgi:hypothetical protein
MSDIFIYQHLGLGDHIVCNGVVRELVKKHNRTCLLVKEHNFISVSSMFKDLDMSYIVVKDDATAHAYITNTKIDTLFKIGHEKLDLKKNFDRSFYEESGIEFEKRWSSWYIPRDLNREQQLFNHFGLKENEYIFVHDDARFPIKNELLPNNLPIVKPILGVTPNIFDYLTILEKAKEIHCIASTFMFIIDSINTCDKIVVHRYQRSGPTWCEPTLKRNWEIIK